MQLPWILRKIRYFPCWETRVRSVSNWYQTDDEFYSDVLAMYFTSPPYKDSSLVGKYYASKRDIIFHNYHILFPHAFPTFTWGAIFHFAPVGSFCLKGVLRENVSRLEIYLPLLLRQMEFQLWLFFRRTRERERQGNVLRCKEHAISSSSSEEMLLPLSLPVFSSNLSSTTSSFHPLPLLCRLLHARNSIERTSFSYSSFFVANARSS